MQRTLQPRIRQKVKQRDRKYRSARLERTGLKELLHHRTAAVLLGRVLALALAVRAASGWRRMMDA
jgi:hypothetical protein